MRPRWRRSASPALLGVLATCVLAAGVLALGGCGAESGSGLSPTPSDGPTQLELRVDSGEGRIEESTLTCDPAGGTHASADTACAALVANGPTALPPVGRDRMCTEIWGGPQTATLTGTWRGQPVTSSFSRTNGCEISRWDQLRGLLPPGGA